MLTVDCFGTIPRGLDREVIIRLAREAYRTGGGEKSASIAVRVVDEAAIRRLNKRYRGRNKATDVLSFAYGGDHFPAAEKAAASQMGDIVICEPQVARQAKKIGRAVKDEFALMVVHGTLHLMGFDHETEAQEKKMFGLQQEVLMRAGLM